VKKSRSFRVLNELRLLKEYTGMKTIIYSIAGVDVPYYAADEGEWINRKYQLFGIDRTVLDTVVDRTACLFRSNGEVIQVKIIEIDSKTFNIVYQEPSGREGTCYWYRFYRRQFRPVE
jgi:hypothetical protein